MSRAADEQQSRASLWTGDVLDRLMQIGHHADAGQGPLACEQVVFVRADDP